MYDVNPSFTGYEPNGLAFNELSDSQGPISYRSPTSDQDMDDNTLGEMLTEAHRGQADYCSPEGMSVRQSSLSVVFDRSGQPDGDRMFNRSTDFGFPRNTYSAHSSFCGISPAERMVDRTGQPVERISSYAQIRTLLEQRQMIFAEKLRENPSSRTSCSAGRRRTSSSTRRNMAAAKRFS